MQENATVWRWEHQGASAEKEEGGDNSAEMLEWLTCSNDGRKNLESGSSCEKIAKKEREKIREDRNRTDTIVNRYSSRRSLRLAEDGVDTRVGMQPP